MSNNLKPPASLLHRPATSTQKLDYGVMVHNLIEEIFNCGLTIGMSAQETHEFATEELREMASKHGVLFPNVHIVPSFDLGFPGKMEFTLKATGKITDADGEGNERSYCPGDPVPLKFEPHPEPHQTK